MHPELEIVFVLAANGRNKSDIVTCPRTPETFYSMLLRIGNILNYLPFILSNKAESPPLSLEKNITVIASL